MRKKIFTFLLALVTSVGLSWAQNPSGSCGENVTWELNTSTGTLTITGSGAMEVYTSYYIPWKNYKSSITSVVITDGVTSVSQYSFSQCENLTSVTIGNDVETIGQFTFNDCGSSFTSLTIGNSVQSIGMAAFLNAKWITELTLPSTLETIGSYALCNLKALSTITIPSSVTSIEASAFSGCTALTSIYVEATTPPTMGNDVFASITGKAYIPLYVPNGSVAAYTAAAQWNEFDIHGYDPSDPGSGEEPGGDDPSTGDGSLSGAFTINAYGDQINFSKGNLQYVGSWQFAANQWDIIGAAQADDNRDLFGWGTGDAPNKVSMTLADYAEYHEWGTNMGDGWYTLSRDEWTYLFQTRTNAADLYAPANVNGVNGFVVLPDEWTLPYGMTFTPGVTNYGTNVYQNAGWTAMENAGAVFLPVAGYRYNGNINWVGQSGFYWSSTVASEGASAWSWLISASSGARRDYYNLYYGMPVRLVKAVVKSDQEFADPVIALIEAIGTVEYTQVCKNRIVEARVAYDHLTDAQKALVSNYSTLTDAEEAYAALTPPPATDGSLSGAFTINGDGDQINFSKGNLQYVGSWQFAEDQWSIIGNAQADDNRDLFGWGTGDAPNKVSMTLADYAEYHEWGENMGDGWYTLSRDEWTYLFQTRTNATNLYAPANVNGVNGFVVLPDEWVQPYGTTFTPGVTNYGTNVYADAAWTSMEDAGAVFLPVAGYRYNGNVNWQGQSGFYWSSTVASAGASAWSWLISASDGARRDYYNLYYGMCVRLVKAASSTPAGPTYLDADFAIDFRTDPYTVVGGGALPTGVEVEGSMNTGDAQHGYRLPVITIPVTAGNYKVMMGTCSYSNQDATIKTEDNSYTYATLETNNGTCYHQNTATNVVGAIFNVPTDQIIKVYGAEYTPFFSIEKMEAVPAFTDFELNFQTNPYNEISGAKPDGTVIIGTYHDNLHGYQNVEAVVPVEAGNYRLTVGACQYGTPGNVMSETNAELASFNSNLGEGNCYHNNTAANIVSTIFTVDMDQTITINGGAYMPYMKLEKLLDNTYYINFENAEGAIGTIPGEIAITAGDSWTIPANLTLYKEGYTFVGWSDGVNTYAPGDEFFPNAHGTLQAVYTPNSVSIADASTINVKWYFGENAGAPSVTWQGTTGYLLAKGEVDGELIDLKLDIDATSGKFHNAGRGDKWAQVNANTVFAFPSKEGAVVSVETYSGNETYDLAAGTLTCNTNDYYSYLEIVYPAPTTAVVIGDP
ncbi:MAG: leucine-rich repeat protein, partial [Paludibacteraceae bacterium]|nr:leucine-rich repeat protein [Paludibacteraceae bacterium]